MVCIGDLSVIQVVTILAAKGFRRIIGAVWIIQMEPEEKGVRLTLLQPRERAINALSRSPVHQPNIAANEGFWRKRIIIKIEASSQSPTPVEHESADHRARRIAVLFESLGDRPKSRIERLAGKILHSVLERIHAGENGRMGRPRQWNLRNGTLEHDAIAA